MKTGNKKLIDYWNGEISIKKSNLKYHSDSIIKSEKKISSLKIQLENAQNKADYHKEKLNEERANISLCEGRIEMLKTTLTS